MHINHRRKNRYRAQRPWWHTAYRYYKRLYSSLRRAEEREFIAHERWDDLPTRYPRCIDWDVD